MALTIGVESGLKDVVKSLRKNGISKEDTRLLYNRSKEDAEAAFKGTNNRKMSTLGNMQQYAMKLEAVEHSYGKEALSEARDNLIKRIHGAKQQVTTGEVKKQNPIEAKKEDNNIDSFLSAEAEENIDSNILGRVTGAERGEMNMHAVAAFESEEGRALIDKTVAEEEKIAKQAQIRENVEKNIAETREAVAKDGRTKQVSGGSFDPYKSYLEKNGDSVSHVAHHNRIKQNADNFNAEYEVMKKNGAEESAYVTLGRKYGFEIKPGGNVQEAANAHFMKKLEADPSLWDKAVGHNVPAKATALGLTGGAVLAMANSRGQKSNAELYGV